MDLRYGGLLRGTLPNRFLHLGAHHAANTPYFILPIIFDGIIHDDDVLVDVGCGKGRVLNWWLLPSSESYLRT